MSLERRSEVEWLRNVDLILRQMESVNRIGRVLHSAKKVEQLLCFHSVVPLSVVKLELLMCCTCCCVDLMGDGTRTYSSRWDAVRVIYTFCRDKSAQRQGTIPFYQHTIANLSTRSSQNTAQIRNR